jgi:hypothetical protein
MIRKVYKVIPLCCLSSGGWMRVISFIGEPRAIDKIIHHFTLSFQTERPPPPQIVKQEL